MTNTNEKYERTQQENLLGLPRPPVAFVSPEAPVNTTRTVNISSSSDAIESLDLFIVLYVVFAL